MQWRRIARLVVCVVVCSGAFGCGDDDVTETPRPRRDAGDDERVCTDADGDGFGKYCDPGTDCDDEDPEITDECQRCLVPTSKGCPCEPGTMAMRCDPPDIEAEGGRLVCREGTRYCREAKWSDCEIIGQYVFVPD
jgi:hypothetical protein